MNREDGKTNHRLWFPTIDRSTSPAKELRRSILKHLDEKMSMGGFVCSEDICNIRSNNVHQGKTGRGYYPRHSRQETKVCRNFTSSRHTADQDQNIRPKIPSHFTCNHPAERGSAQHEWPGEGNLGRKSDSVASQIFPRSRRQPLGRDKVGKHCTLGLKKTPIGSEAG